MKSQAKRKEESVIRANHHAEAHTLACSFFSSIHALSDHLPSVTSFRLSDPVDLLRAITALPFLALRFFQRPKINSSISTRTFGSAV
jgi:hypothetical protein